MRYHKILFEIVAFIFFYTFFIFPVHAIELNIGNKTLTFLPQKSQTMFPNLYADPYHTQLSLSKSLNRDQYIGRIGQSVYLFHLHPGWEQEKDMRGMYLGLTGYSWSLLNREGNKFPLLAVDYLIAGFIDFRYQWMAWRIKYSHISAHLGDKHFPGTVSPRVYSREFVSIYSVWQWKSWSVYGGLHWIYHSIPEAQPLNLQAGLVLNLGEPFQRGFSPYLSINMDAIGEFDYHLNFSFQAGARLFFQDSKAYRVAFSYYNGYKEFGQYYDQTTQYSAIGLYFDY